MLVHSPEIKKRSCCSGVAVDHRERAARAGLHDGSDDVVHALRCGWRNMSTSRLHECNILFSNIPMHIAPRARDYIGNGIYIANALRQRIDNSMHIAKLVHTYFLK